MRPGPCLLCPDRLRTIEKPFSWLPFRLLKDGIFANLSDNAKLLYIFLCLAADRQGLSFYGDPRIQTYFQLTPEEIHRARNELIQKDLIAYNGHIYQVLSLPSTGALPTDINPSPEPRTSQPERLGDILKRLALADH